MTTMGDRIRRARRESPYPRQEDLATIIGVARVAISNWENNIDVPETRNLIALAKATGKSLDWLCGIQQQEISSEAVMVSQSWDFLPENARAGLKSTIDAFIPKTFPEAK